MSVFFPASWPPPLGVRALTTLRHGLGGSRPPFDSFNLGARCGDDVAAVAANRAALVSALALPSPPRWLRQVHGTGVVRDPGFDEPKADAAVTAVPGVVLAILTADCLPVVLAALDGSEIAVAHAGWRGLCSGVLEVTVAAMRTRPDRLQAWLGPCAGPSAYEVGGEVVDAFTRRDGRAHMAFLPTRPGHWNVDLPMLARQRLLAVGVQAVYGGQDCTISAPDRHFSHRRDQRTGRMATLAWRQA